MTVYTAQTYNNPSLLNSDPGDPMTSELAKAMLFNSRAIAQAASGADTMEQAWHFVAGFSDANDIPTNGAIDIPALGGFDPLDYDTLEIVCAFDTIFTTTGAVSLEVFIDGGVGWVSVAGSSGASSTDGHIIRACVTNMQSKIGGIGKQGWSWTKKVTGATWQTIGPGRFTPDNDDKFFYSTSNAISDVRLIVGSSSGGGIYGASSTTTQIGVYGRKMMHT